MTTRSKLVIAALALAGISFIVIGFVVGNDGAVDEAVRRAEGVIAIRPQRGDEVLRQKAISIRLEPGYRLVSMRIFDTPSLTGGVDVTAFVREVEGVNDYVYTPAEGLPVETLSADDNCVVVRFEDITRPGDVNDLDWCFKAS